VTSLVKLDFDRSADDSEPLRNNSLVQTHTSTKTFSSNLPQGIIAFKSYYLQLDIRMYDDANSGGGGARNQ